MWLSTIYVVFLLFLHESAANIQERNSQDVSSGKDPPMYLRSDLEPNPRLPIANNNERTMTSKNRKKLRYSAWYNKLLESPSKSGNATDKNGILEYYRRNNKNVLQNPYLNFRYKRNFTMKSRPPLSIRDFNDFHQQELDSKDAEYIRNIIKNRNSYHKKKHSRKFHKGNGVKSNMPLDINGIQQQSSKDKNYPESYNNINVPKSKLAFKSGKFHHHVKRIKTGNFSNDSFNGSKNNHNHKKEYFHKHKKHSHKNVSLVDKRRKVKKKYFHDHNLKKKYFYDNSSNRFGVDFRTNLTSNSKKWPINSKHLHKHNKEKYVSHNKTLSNFKKGHFEKKSKKINTPYFPKKFKKGHVHKSLGKLKKRHIHNNPILKHKKGNFKKKLTKHAIYNNSTRKFKKKTNHKDLLKKFKKRKFRKISLLKYKKHFLRNHSKRKFQKKRFHNKRALKHKGNFRNIFHRKLKKGTFRRHHVKNSIFQPFRNNSTIKLKKIHKHKKFLKKSKNHKRQNNDNALYKTLQRKYSLLKSMDVIKSILLPNTESKNHLYYRMATVDAINVTEGPMSLSGGITIPPPTESINTEKATTASE